VQLRLDALEQLREERAADLREDQPDRVGLAAGKHPRGGAGDEVQFGDGPADPLGFLRLDGDLPVQHPADGGNGYPRMPGDV